MDRDHLSIYLHDHLAGAQGALELLASLEKAFAGAAVGRFATKLREEIEFERGQLRPLAAQFPSTSGVPRKIAAWIAEKGFELKLSFDGPAAKAFRLFESLEALSVGIAGKRLLWRALRHEAVRHRELDGLDYQKLIAMAVRQREEVERFRLAAAKAAFDARAEASERVAS